MPIPVPNITTLDQDFLGPTDTHLYSDDEIIQLLKHYIGDHPDVAYLDPMLGTNWGGKHNTLKENLHAYHAQRVQAQEEGRPIKNKVIIPINLANSHWVLLYVIYPENPNQLPQIYHFDPMGAEPNSDLKAALRDTNEAAFDCEIINISQRVQKDGYNCGAWIVETARAIADGKTIPEQDYDIHRARNEHNNVIHALSEPDQSLQIDEIDTNDTAIQQSTQVIAKKLSENDIEQKTSKTYEQDILHAALKSYGFFEHQPLPEEEADRRLAIQLQNQEILNFLSKR